MKRFGCPAWLYLCVPVLVGALVMVGCRAPFARWGVHLCAGLLGLATYRVTTAVRWRPPRGVATWFSLVALIAVASTLLSSGTEGVRRWHELGPLRVHPSALLTPVLLVFAAGRLGGHRVATHALLLGVQAVHFLQPDAGQATALGFGAVILVVMDSGQRSKGLLVGLYLISVAGTWMRFDPLPPVAFVEDIVRQAFALAPAAGVAALAALAVLVLSPLLAGPAGPAPVALAGSFAGSLVAARFGEFPVPLLGFGASSTVGAFLGLAALRRSQLAPVTVEPRASEASGNPVRVPRCAQG